MKPYEELILSYINKYHKIDLVALSYELGLNISLTSDIIRKLLENNYFIVNDESVEVTDKAITQITSLWNDWSFSKKQMDSSNKKNFRWDYLYIPKNFDNI